jgi:hypothetical protein
MQFISLLGKKLKNDEMIEILEGLEMDVIYDFDRLHEGQPDKYWAASKESGFQFRFDETQTLDVIFLYVVASDGYAAISRHDSDVSFFSSGREAQTSGEARHLLVAKGCADFLGVNREWVRLGFTSYSVHYEFHGGNLARVTITKNDESQPA